MIENPVIRGFNPDPSVIRVGDDFYVATSTFEWWPGVCIYHSRDLRHWRLHSRPLDRMSMLDLTGVPDSGGVWAPDITYDGKTFYLVYTNVRERGPMMQTDNYVVMTDDIDGEWSEPVYLNSMGFDPSMFHDRDGRTWLLSLNNHYGKNQRFNGLYIQEFDTRSRRLVGDVRLIYREPHGELVEGSHIYHFGDTYYLLKAQGGTGRRHSAQLSRSQSLYGPWEDCPDILLHSRDDVSLPLQCAGHADILDTPDGELFLFHLATRYSSEGHSIFGRETCLQRIEWTSDGWLRLSDGGQNPHVYVSEPDLPEHKFPADDGVYDFTCGPLPDCFQSLRLPLGDRIRFTGSALSLRGSNGLNSRFEQTLLARRIDSARVRISTRLLFEPEHEKHMAGLILIYDTQNWHYLYVTRSERGQKQVCVLTCNKGAMEYPAEPIAINESTDIELHADINGADLHFSFSDGGELRSIGGELDINILADVAFTGAMAGICCQDLMRKEKCAEFHWFRYETCSDNNSDNNSDYNSNYNNSRKVNEKWIS